MGGAGELSETTLVPWSRAGIADAVWTDTTIIAPVTTLAAAKPTVEITMRRVPLMLAIEELSSESSGPAGWPGGGDSLISGFGSPETCGRQVSDIHCLMRAPRFPW
jgi:hypothetical protein